MSMLTRKQEQGIRILESIVQSEYPFVVSLKVSDKPLDIYPSILEVELEIDPITLSNVLDIPFDIKFKSNEVWGYYSGKDSNLSYVVHLFPEEYNEITGYRFNNKIEDFMTKAYTQLPTTMRINSYSTTPDDLIPDWAKRLNLPRNFNIGKFYIAQDSNKPTRFED
jgi:hypothetical protein